MLTDKELRLNHELENLKDFIRGLEGVKIRHSQRDWECRNGNEILAHYNEENARYVL